LQKISARDINKKEIKSSNMLSIVKRLNNATIRWIKKVIFVAAIISVTIIPLNGNIL